MNELAPLPRRIAWFAPWRWKRRWKITVVLLVMIVGYPLSLGPVWKLAINGWLPPQVVLVYTPLAAFTGACPAGKEWVRWYGRFFSIEFE